jgi:uncharacterized protein (TIGR02145 family)
MKEFVWLFTIVTFLSSCKKNMNEFGELSSSSGSNKSKTERIQVCHYDRETGTSHAITINENAWPAHQKHGDVLGDCAVETITIGEQTWMLKNLDVDHYRNGDPIPHVTDNFEWITLTTGAWCWYENDSATYAAIYGKLYNWYAVNDRRGLASTGWHVPSDPEWSTLSQILGGDAVAGDKLKEAGNAYWQNGNTGTNSSGFTGIPGGFRGIYFGDFAGIGYYSIWWSSTVENATFAFTRNLNYNNESFDWGHSEKQNGFSVRCVKDAP